jgi:NADPH2:quinone reductase
MHAIVVEEFGDASKLLWREVPDPVAGPGQVAVRQQLTSVNFADIASRRGIGSKVPFTPGLDGMGTVIAVGAGVTRVKPGDRVAVWSETGTYCEIVVAREELVYPVAASVPDEVAASPTVLVTAYNILHLASRLEAGESVLIHAAAGGVGSVLVQIAKEIGAGKIVATAGSAEKLAIARDFGADVAIDYRSGDWAQAVLDATGGKGVDVICDAIGGDTFAEGLKCLAPFGRHVIYGQSSGGPGTLRTDALHRQNRAVIGYSSGHRRRTRPASLQSAFDGAYKLVAEGKVRILEGGRFPLREAAAAQTLVESRASTGRVFLTI